MATVTPGISIHRLRWTAVFWVSVGLFVTFVQAQSDDDAIVDYKHVKGAKEPKGLLDEFLASDTKKTFNAVVGGEGADRVIRSEDSRRARNKTYAVDPNRSLLKWVFHLANRGLHSLGVPASSTVRRKDPQKHPQSTNSSRGTNDMKNDFEVNTETDKRINKAKLKQALKERDQNRIAEKLRNYYRKKETKPIAVVPKGSVVLNQRVNSPALTILPRKRSDNDALVNKLDSFIRALTNYQSQLQTSEGKIEGDDNNEKAGSSTVDEGSRSGKEVQKTFYSHDETLDDISDLHWPVSDSFSLSKNISSWVLRLPLLNDSLSNPGKRSTQKPKVVIGSLHKDDQDRPPKIRKGNSMAFQLSRSPPLHDKTEFGDEGLIYTPHPKQYITTDYILSQLEELEPANFPMTEEKKFDTRTQYPRSNDQQQKPTLKSDELLMTPRAKMPLSRKQEQPKWEALIKKHALKAWREKYREFSSQQGASVLSKDTDSWIEEFPVQFANNFLRALQNKSNFSERASDGNENLKEDYFKETWPSYLSYFNSIITVPTDALAFLSSYEQSKPNSNIQKSRKIRDTHQFSTNIRVVNGQRDLDASASTLSLNGRNGNFPTHARTPTQVSLQHQGSLGILPNPVLKSQLQKLAQMNEQFEQSKQQANQQWTNGHSDGNRQKDGFLKNVKTLTPDNIRIHQSNPVPNLNSGNNFFNSNNNRPKFSPPINENSRGNNFQQPFRPPINNVRQQQHETQGFRNQREHLTTTPFNRHAPDRNTPQVNRQFIGSPPIRTDGNGNNRQVSRVSENNFRNNPQRFEIPSSIGPTQVEGPWTFLGQSPEGIEQVGILEEFELGPPITLNTRKPSPNKLESFSNNKPPFTTPLSGFHVNNENEEPFQIWNSQTQNTFEKPNRPFKIQSQINDRPFPTRTVHFPDFDQKERPGFFPIHGHNSDNNGGSNNFNPFQGNQDETNRFQKPNFNSERPPLKIITRKPLKTLDFNQQSNKDSTSFKAEVNQQKFPSLRPVPLTPEELTTKPFRPFNQNQPSFTPNRFNPHESIPSQSSEEFRPPFNGNQFINNEQTHVSFQPHPNSNKSQHVVISSEISFTNTNNFTPNQNFRPEFTSTSSRPNDDRRPNNNNNFGSGFPTTTDSSPFIIDDDDDTSENSQIRPLDIGFVPTLRPHVQIPPSKPFFQRPSTNSLNNNGNKVTFSNDFQTPTTSHRPFEGTRQPTRFEGSNINQGFNQDHHFGFNRFPNENHNNNHNNNHGDSEGFTVEPNPAVIPPRPPFLPPNREPMYFFPSEPAHNDKFHTTTPITPIRSQSFSNDNRDPNRFPQTVKDNFSGDDVRRPLNQRPFTTAEPEVSPTNDNRLKDHFFESPQNPRNHFSDDIKTTTSFAPTQFNSGRTQQSFPSPETSTVSSTPLSTSKKSPLPIPKFLTPFVNFRGNAVTENSLVSHSAVTVTPKAIATPEFAQRTPFPPRPHRPVPPPLTSVSSEEDSSFDKKEEEEYDILFTPVTNKPRPSSTPIPPQMVHFQDFPITDIPRFPTTFGEEPLQTIADNRPNRHQLRPTPPPHATFKPNTNSLITNFVSSTPNFVQGNFFTNSLPETEIPSSFRPFEVVQEIDTFEEDRKHISPGKGRFPEKPRVPPPPAGSPASPCNPEVCRLPHCYCGGSNRIPGDLSANEVPQLVMLTFDDDVNEVNWIIYKKLLYNGRRNPNGCPIQTTFYVSHEWTDYSKVQTLYADGHEIASHSISHPDGANFPKQKWTDEIYGQKEILSYLGGVPKSDIRGMRAPFLAIGGNKMFSMLYDSNFTYDSSLPVPVHSPPFWPYTLDYALGHDCMITPCPTNSYPGVWELPMVMWVDLKNGRCSMADACQWPDTKEKVFETIMKNFERHYKSNRAPFNLFYHSAWFEKPHNMDGFQMFLDKVLTLPDVYFVTSSQVIEWMRRPTPLRDIHSFIPFSCHLRSRHVNHCKKPHECQLRFKSEIRYVRTCQECPSVYPWVRNPHGKSANATS